MTSPKDIRNSIIEFITPFMTNEATRRTHISNAFWGDPIVETIDYTGNAYVFTSNLFNQLWNYDGRKAVEILLDELAKTIGTDKQDQVELFKQQLDMLGAAPPAKRDVDAASKRLSGGNQTNISIGGSVSNSNINVDGTQNIGNGEDQ